MKKYLSLSLALLLALSLGACSQTAPTGQATNTTPTKQSSEAVEPTTEPTSETPAETTAAETAEAAPLSEEQELALYAAYFAANPDEAAQFSLYDWDGDGVRELYLFSQATQEHLGRMGVYTIRGGEVVPVYQSGDHGVVDMCFEIVNFRGENFLCEVTHVSSASQDPVIGSYVLLDGNWQTVHTIRTETAFLPEMDALSDISSITVDNEAPVHNHIAFLFENTQMLLNSYDPVSGQMSYAELVAFAGAAN